MALNLIMDVCLDSTHVESLLSISHRAWLAELPQHDDWHALQSRQAKCAGASLGGKFPDEEFRTEPLRSNLGAIVRFLGLDYRRTLKKTRNMKENWVRGVRELQEVRSRGQTTCFKRLQARDMSRADALAPMSMRCIPQYSEVFSTLAAKIPVHGESQRDTTSRCWW